MTLRKGGSGESTPAAAKKTGDIYEAKDTFQGSLDDGTTVFVTKGERVRDGHPIVRKWPSLFQPLTIQYDIEDASADPGVRRGEPGPWAGKEKTK